MKRPTLFFILSRCVMLALTVPLDDGRSPPKAAHFPFRLFSFFVRNLSAIRLTALKNTQKVHAKKNEFKSFFKFFFFEIPKLPFSLKKTFLPTTNSYVTFRLSCKLKPPDEDSHAHINHCKRHQPQPKWRLFKVSGDACYVLYTHRR